MSTHKLWWLALPLAAAALTFAPTAHADPGFGLVPEFKFGPNFGSVPGADAAGKPITTGSSGWLFEGDFDAFYASDRFAIGSSFGYVVQGLASAGRRTSIGMGYNGFTITPMFMLALSSRISLVAHGGLVIGDIGDGQADDVGALGWRVGAQLLFVVARLSNADVTLGLEYLHTEATGTYPDNSTVSYAGNAIVLTTTMSFFADMLDL
jgi:hypothetical protein